VIRSLRSVALGFLFLFLVPDAFAAAGVPVWTAREEGVNLDSEEQTRTVAKLVDGSVMVLVFTGGNSSASALYAIRYAADGTQLSAVVLDAPAGASSWIITPFGEVVLAVPFNVPGAQQRMWIMKYDGYTGRRHWTQAALVGNGVETVYSGPLRVSATGDVFYVTPSRGVTPDTVAIVKLNGGDGAQEWRTNLDLGPQEGIRAFELTSSGNVAYAGSDMNPMGGVTRLMVGMVNGATGAPMWNGVQPSGQPQDSFSRLAVDSTGAIVAVGKVRNSSSNDDAVIVKYSAAGVFQWRQQIQWTLGNTDQATVVAFDQSNNVFWAGLTQTGTAQSDVLAGKISPAGTVLWTVTKSGTNHEKAIDLVVDGNGDAVISGWANSQQTGASCDFGTWKLRNATGATLWTNIYATPNSGNDIPERVLLDDSGDLYVAGNSWFSMQLNRITGSTGVTAWARNWAESTPDPGISSSGTDAAGNIITVRYEVFGMRRISRFDGATGARLWSMRYFNYGMAGLSLRVAPDGSFALFGSNNGDGLALMFNSDSTLRWTKTWGTTGISESGAAAAFDPAGNLVIAGTVEQSQYGSTNLQTLKLSAATGAQLWSHTYTAGSGNSARPHAIAIDASGDIAVSGKQRIPIPTASLHAQLLLRIGGATGTLMWPAQVNGSMNGSGDEWENYVGVAIDASGNVITSGPETPASNNYEVVTRKFDGATGSVLWTSTYAGAADDSMHTIALDSAGNAVVLIRAELPAADTKIVIEKYAGATGLLEWSRTFDDGAGYPDDPTALRISAADDVYVAGLTLSLRTFRDAIVLRYAADGTVIWPAAPLDDRSDDQRVANLHLIGGNAIVITGDILARLGEPFAVVTPAIAAATCGQPYSFTVAAANGTAPYTFSSSNLPGFLSLDAATGELTASSVPPGTWPITIDVTDGTSATTSRTFTLDAFSRADDVQLTAAANPACIATNVSVSGTWSTYLWSTGATTAAIAAPVTHEALYGVTVNDGSNCSMRGTIVLRGLQPLSAVSITPSGAMSACPSGTGGSIASTVTGGSSTTYQWGYRSSPGGPTTNIAGQTGVSYTVNGAHFPGVGTWYVVLRVTPSCGTPTDSNEVAVSIVNLVAPTNVVATATAPGTITVTWTAAPGSVDHYNVYRSAKACPGDTFTYVGPAFGTTFTDPGLTPGSDYSYLVRSASPGNSCVSAPSNCDDATAYGDCPADPTFGGLTSVTANNCLLRLTWSPATSNCLNAKSVVYNVYRSTSSTFTPGAANRIARCITSTFYDDVTAPAGTNYYVVRAEDSALGNGGPCGGGNEETNTARRSGVMATPSSATTYYRDNFDTVRPASNPNAYWKEIITAGADHIATSTCKPDGGTTYKFGVTGLCSGTYAINLNQRLELGGDGTVDPAVNGMVIPASGSVRLRFRHLYQLESGWDGVSLYYRSNTVTTPTLVGESVSATAPYLVQGLYTGSANSSGHRVWTGTQGTFTEVIVNLDAVRGQTVWFQWRFTTDSSVNYDGYHLDDVNIETVTALACDITGPLQALTVTARDGVNKLEWLNPASSHYATTILRYRTDGVYPTSATDGLPVGSGTKTGTSDTYDSVDHTVTNGTSYRYTAFVQAANGLVGPGRAAMGRAEPVASTKWIYNTGATAMTPPGIGSIYAVSNDRILHSIQQGTTGGVWVTGWRPFAMNAPSQARPVIASMTVNQIGGAPKVAFIGSQDGYVYAVNAGTGAQLWGTSIGTIVQGSPALAFREFGAGLTNVDLVLAGTRNSAPPNGMYALNTQGGTAAWSYTGGGTYTIGIIGGSAVIDAAANRVYFASRAASASANQNHTLWCLSFDDTTVTRVWSVPLGDIDGTPLLANGTLYVGTNSGTLYAVDPATGTTLATLATGDGPLKGHPAADANGRVYFSTTNKVWSVADSLSAPRTLSAAWSVSSAGVPSAAVLANNALWFGSSNGRLYKLSQLTDPAPAIAYVQLGTGLAAAGAIGYDTLNDLAYVGAADGAIYAVSIP
jgi:outer membrane protein assembly factor BamB